MAKCFIEFVCVAVLLAGCQIAKQPNSKIGIVNGLSAVDSLISQQVLMQHIAGAVVRIQKGDIVLQRKAYGYAKEFNYNNEILTDPVKVTVNHMFDLASLTKVFATTYGIMLLMSNDKIHLDDHIYKWFPSFQKGAKRKITVFNLLTHSAGLYKWKPTYYFAENQQQQLKFISELPLKWPVGQGRHYSDLGFILLGNIIERVSGQPLNVYLQNKLYNPLNLSRTVFNPKEKGFKKIAATSHGNPFERHMVYDDSFGYKININPNSWNGWRHYTIQGEVSDGNAWYVGHGVAGHAGLFSTVDNLQKLVDLLLNQGKYRGKRLISKAVIDTFLTKTKYNMGLGWEMAPSIINTKGAPKGTFGHTGFTGTSVVVVPKYNLSIILLTNRENVGLQPDGYYYNLDSLRQKILNITLEMVKKKYVL